jgi:hypothetical protein
LDLEQVVEIVEELEAEGEVGEAEWWGEHFMKRERV